MSNYWEKKLDELNKSNGKSSSGSSSSDNYWERKRAELKEENKKKKKKEDDDIAPVATASKKDDDERSWFQRGAFDDGYQFGDITKTLLGTDADILGNIGTGARKMVENVVDTAAYGVGAIGKAFGADKFANNVSEFIAKDVAGDTSDKKLPNWAYSMASSAIPATLKPFADVARGILVADEFLNGEDDASVLGDKSDSLIQSGTQLAATIGMQGVGVPWWLTSGVTAFGGEVESAFGQDATYTEAGASGLISAGAEILTEKISGGIKFGGKALDDGLTRTLAQKISNKFLRNGLKLGLDFVGEGGEEWITEDISRFGQWLTYRDDEELKELLFSEEAMDAKIESFLSGGIIGGGMGGVNIVSSRASGRDYTSGMTANEEAVFNKEYESRISEEEKDGKKLTKKEKNEIYDQVLEAMERGEISTDTIEEVLGGDSYKAYRDTVDSEDALVKEFDELGSKQNATLAEQSRYAELKQQIEDMKQNSKRNDLKTQLSQSVYGMVQNDRLAESYYERGRRSQAFTADLSKYDEKQRAVVQNAIDSGILNNTRRSHQLVDILSRISADKGVAFNFADNAKLKESGFAIEGKQVNGFITKDGITLNIDSPKAWQSTVGHEVTHVLEGTELYGELQTALFDYAKSKGEYDSRLADLTELYKDIADADVNAELTADLVGDYLFTDSDFVNNLHANHRNVFQKIYDEVKYLLKVTTAGSKEAKQLEKVKKAFEDAYRAGGKAQTDTKYSIGEIVDENNKSYGIGVHLDSTLLDNLTLDERKAMVRERIKELGGDVFTAYDNNGNAVDITIAKPTAYFKNKNGKKRRVTHDLTEKYNGNEVKQEAVVLIDELITTSKLQGTDPARYSHGWLDNNGQNDWDVWTTYIQDKNNTIWEATLHIANTANGEKIIYDVVPTKKVGQSRNLDTSLLNGSVTQPAPVVKTDYSLSDTSGRQLTAEQQEYFKDSKVRDENGNVIPLSERFNEAEVDIRRSLSKENAAPVKYGNFSTPARDLKLETAPVQEGVSETEITTPVQETVTGEDVQEMFPDDLAPIADDPERFDSLMDEDAPPETVVEHGEMGNQISLPKSAVSWIAKTARESIGLSNNQMADLHKLIEDYSVQEFPSREQLFNDIKDKFGIIVEADEDGEIKEVKRHLRSQSIYVSDTIKGDIADYNEWRRAFFGSLRFSRNGMPVDSAYQELSSLYPGFFPADITNPTEQLLQMAAVSKYEAKMEREWDIDDDTLWGVTDDIIESINDYQKNQLDKTRERESREAFDSLVKSGEDFAPPVSEDDIAPVKQTDAEVKTAPTDQEKEAEQRTKRSDLHASIVDRVRSAFTANGFDLDTVLRKAKNLSTFATVDNTPQRVMEKALGYKEGQVLADMTVNKVAQNETEGIKWLNSFTDRKNGMLAKLSEQYNIKPGSKESAAAQMYAEGFYVDENNDIVQYGDAELAADFPDAKVRENIKGLAGDARIRQIYDDTLAMINESRARNLYPEIQRLDNYFLHFRAMGDTFSQLGLPFNPNDIKAKDLPTDLNGVTADLKPGQPFFASAMHRTGKRTSFDLLGGLERYLTSAKNQIYHIDDIQTLRALRNYIADTYGQANGLEGLDALSEEEAQDKIEKVYNSHLSTFAKFLNEEANVLAGKTTLIDRGFEGFFGRRGITFLDTLNKQVGSNMVGYNISSSLTNFIPVAQTLAKSSKGAFVKAFAQTVSNKINSITGKSDGFAEQSPVMIRRKGADRFHRTAWQMMADPGYALMGAVDSISTELIARTKYNELIKNGMDSQQAHIETDKWVSRLMGDRSLGQQPQIYNSKMLGLVTKFQLEVRNQLDSQFYDTIQETKVSNEHIENRLARNAKTAAKVASTFVQLAVVQHLFGKAFESVAGYNPAFDIIEVLATAFGFDDEEDSEDTALDNIEQGFLALLEDLPYTGVITDGGRIPISAALPDKSLFAGKDKYGNDVPFLENLWENAKNIAPYYALPGGYGQIKKTVQGLSMFSDDHPVAGSYTDSGNLRFPVDDTLANKVQAGLFGQWASKNARDYFDNNRSALKEKQIQEFIDVDIPIRDYWEYREGLNKQEDLESKFDYIAGLDLPVAKKNILINNVVDRKDDVDMTSYDDFSNFEEFDFYTKNKEKYEFLQENGISYEEYTRTVVRKERYDSIYSWYKNNPEGVTLSKAITDNVIEYRGYTSALNDIKADKDSKGKSISGSRKEKVVDYVNQLDLDYGQRLILFKSEYNADDTYNNDIVDYLNNRSDLTYNDRVTILKELGFEVDSEGNIYW